VPDAVSVSSSPDAAFAVESGPPSSRKATRVSRKTAAAKSEKRSSARKSPKNAGDSGATARVKVGPHTITVPKTLATNLTSKDVKKMRAIFKRARKRGKKRSEKKGAKKGA
jgi:hypothetical protein